MKKLAAAFLMSFILGGAVMAQPTMRNTGIFDSGDLLVSTTGRMFDGELSRANEPYADNIVGVFSATTPGRNVPAILENGIAYVKFDPQNGHVQKGDFITSSSNSGHAMKATQPGFVLGVALEDSPKSQGLLKVRVQVCWVKL